MPLPTFLRAVVLAFTVAGVALPVMHSRDAAPARNDPARADTTVYELRTYTAHPGKLPNVLSRFREHTTALFTKHGMVNVGYFVPLDSADGAGSKLVYVLQHASRDAAKASWRAFGADPEWKAVAAASEVNGPIVAKVESVFMTATDFSPSAFVAARGSARVFELRRYTTPDGVLPKLDARFRDHTTTLFAQHGMTNVAYWHPTDSIGGANHTLIYLLAHSSRDAATANWTAFRSDSVWIQAKAASEKAVGGSLTTEVKSMFLTPTDFSTLR